MAGGRGRGRGPRRRAGTPPVRAADASARSKTPSKELGAAHVGEHVGACGDGGLQGREVVGLRYARHPQHTRHMDELLQALASCRTWHLSWWQDGDS